MLRRVCAGISWVGRAATFLGGLAVVVGLVAGPAAVGLAAVPGDPLRLGRVNAIDKLTSLTGSVPGALLKVDNNGGGPAMDLRVEAGAAPFKVNSAEPVPNLNADLLDGRGAGAFLPAAVYKVTAPLNVPNDTAEHTGTADCDPGDRAVGGGYRGAGTGTVASASAPAFGAGGAPTGWFAAFRNTGAGASSPVIDLACADLGQPHAG